VNFNQPVCLTCFITRWPGRVPVRGPARLRTTVERCAYCGGEACDGIFVRAHPDSVPFPKPDEDTADAGDSRGHER
jgi:hypothetical protein